jgi:hypothetical protein
VAALAVSATLEQSAREAVWWALALALAVQAPMGWWVVRSLGEEGLLRAWGVGMITRLALLAVGAWVLHPAVGVPLAPLLVALAAALLALLGIEVVVLMQRMPQRGAR